MTDNISASGEFKTAIGILILIAVGIFAWATWPIFIWFCSVGLLLTILVLARGKLEDGLQGKDLNARSYGERVRFSLFGNLMIIAWSIFSGIIIVSVLQALLKFRSSIASDQVVRDWEEKLSGLYGSLSSFIGIETGLAILVVLAVLAFAWPQRRFVTKYLRLNGYVRIVLTVLLTITSFTFFSSETLGRFDRVWRAEAVRDLEQRLERAISEQTLIVAARWVEERAQSLDRSTRNDIANLLTAPERIVRQAKWSPVTPEPNYEGFERNPRSVKFIEAVRLAQQRENAAREKVREPASVTTGQRSSQQVIQSRPTGDSSSGNLDPLTSSRTSAKREISSGLRWYLIEKAARTIANAAPRVRESWAELSAQNTPAKDKPVLETAALSVKGPSGGSTLSLPELRELDDRTGAETGRLIELRKAITEAASAAIAEFLPAEITEYGRLLAEEIISSISTEALREALPIGVIDRNSARDWLASHSLIKEPATASTQQKPWPWSLRTANNISSDIPSREAMDHLAERLADKQEKKAARKDTPKGPSAPRSPEITTPRPPGAPAGQIQKRKIKKRR